MRLTVLLGAQAGLGAATASRAPGNAIGKVVSMLGDMKSKAEHEMQEEAKTFAAFSTWCDQTKTKLAAAIEAGVETIDEYAATVTAETARAKTLKTEVAAANEEIAALEQVVAGFEAERSKEKAAWEKVNAEFESNISAVQKAQEVIKSMQVSVALLQTGSDNKKAAAAASVTKAHALVQIEQASSMTRAQKDIVTVLVQGDDGYESSSGGVMEMLKNLEDQFVDDQRAAAKDEQALVGAHNEKVMAKQGEIKALEEVVSRKSSAAGEAETAAGAAAEAQATEEGVLEQNKKSQGEVTSNCELKSKEEKIRTKTRSEEIAAIQQAIEVLTGYTGLAQVSSLMQLRTATGTQEDNKKNYFQALDVLKKAAQSQHSKKLAMLALKLSENTAGVTGNAMGKVIQMIKDMINKLKEEGLKEAGKAGQCKGWMAENKDAFDNANESIAEQERTVKDTQATMELKASEIEKINIQQADMDATVAEATTTRAAEKKENAASIEDAKQGEVAVTAAIETLREFYEGAAKSTALVQQPVVVETPGTWDSTYNGQQDAGSGVIGILESVAADFVRIQTETQALESNNQRAYDKLVADEQVATAKRQANLRAATKARNENEVANGQAKEALGVAKDQYSDAVEQKRVIEVDKGCKAFAGMTIDEIYEAKKQARAAEIESLKQAFEILGGHS